MGGSCGVVVPRLILPATIPGGFAGLEPDPQGYARTRLSVVTGPRSMGQATAACPAGASSSTSVPGAHLAAIGARSSNTDGTRPRATIRPGSPEPKPFAGRSRSHPYAGSAPIWLPRQDPYRGYPGPRPLYRPQPSSQGFRPRVSHVVPCSSSRRILQRSGHDQERGVRDFHLTRARRHADLRVPIRSDLSELDAGASDFPAARVGRSGERPYACRRRRCSNDCMSRRPSAMTKT